MANNWQLGITIHFPQQQQQQPKKKKRRNNYTLIEKFYNQKQNKRGISSPNQYAPTSFFPSYTIVFDRLQPTDQIFIYTL